MATSRSSGGPNMDIPASGPQMVGADLEAFQRSTKRRKLSDTSSCLFFSIVLADALMDFAAQVHADIEAFLSLDAQHFGKPVAVWRGLVQGAFPELCLRRYSNLDRMLLALVLRCRQRRHADASGLHDFIEYACGRGNLTLQCLRHGLHGVGLDKLFGLAHDVLHPHGLRLWINELSVTKTRSVNWFGTQCSSFVPMCLNNSKRSAENSYLGDETKEFVCQGNMLMNVTALLMMLSFWLGNVPVLEQPLGSVMPKCIPLQTALAFMGADRVVTWHGAFGSKSMKPLQILSPSVIIQVLKRDKPHGASTRLARSNSAGQFTGVKGRMTKSGEYTMPFGACVARMAKRHLERQV
jgi:hypothetical protein